MNINVETLKKIGNEWKTEKHHRIYFNDLVDLVGLKYSRYGTGNISSASLNGEHISNTKAKKLLFGLDTAKVWYDVKEGKFHGKLDYQVDEYFEIIVEKIKAMADEMDSSAEADSQYRVVSEPANVDGETVTVYAVVDVDGAPINDGHFTSESDAQYVCQKMNTDELHGDWVSTLCRSMDSWVQV